MIEKAVDEGYNVIVMPGYAFGGAIKEAQDTVSRCQVRGAGRQRV